MSRLKYKDANGNWQYATSYHQVIQLGGGTPAEGTISITENGTHDVASYASAEVSVPVGVFPTGTLEITENGIHDVYDKMAVDVNVPSTGITPTGTYLAQENGTFDISQYEFVQVEVASSGSEDIEAVVLSGNQDGACKGTMAQAFISTFPTKVSTENITSASEMFYGYLGETIPFDINFKSYTGTSTTTVAAMQLFRGCTNLKTIPAVNNLSPAGASYMFYGCQQLNSFPEDFAENWNFYGWHNSGWFEKGYLFYNCYSLRDVPQTLIDNLYCNQTDSYYSSWNYNFWNCYNLDKVVNMPIPYKPSSGTASEVYDNLYTAAFNNCHNLKRLTFKSGQSGNYTAQVIDLSTCGWRTTSTATDYQRTRYNYNSGRTIDDCIYNADTYAANKDNPNAYVAGTSAEEAWKYSLYNHDSAVETINSLPDFSTGGSNVIKFKGEAGAYTDGGAINTLTEEEIAVAATKGWTVTLA